MTYQTLKLEKLGEKKLKEILGTIKKAQVQYISAGKYVLKAESDNPKTADNTLKEILQDVENQAKKEHLDFQIIEK